MSTSPCRVGDEIEILCEDEWYRHKVTSLEYTPDPNAPDDRGRWTVYVFGEAYVWFHPDDLSFTWRHTQATVPVTGVYP